MDGEACKHSDTYESIGTCKQWCAAQINTILLFITQNNLTHEITQK